MKKPIIFIMFTLVVVIALTIGQIAVSNSLTVSGITLSELQKEQKQYQKENALLKEKILTGSSLTNIASAAATLGFISERSALYVREPLPLAIK